MVTPAQITLSDVQKAQKSWAEGIVNIGQKWATKGAYQSAADHFVRAHYAYDYACGTVLFKPTKVQNCSFRATHASALSYFIGGNLDFAEDNGFALAPWTSITFKNHGFYHHYDVATVMGHYDFFDQSENKVSVEYTFGYLRTKQGALKIFLHHSSLPYRG